MLVKTRNNRGYYPSVFDTFFNEMDVEKNVNLFTKPDFNVFETDKEFVIEAAVPGLEKKNFNIDVNDNLLTISSEIEVKEEKDVENKSEKYHYRGFQYGSFKKTYSLPKNVDKERIEAKYKNGILTLEIPKDEEIKLSKQIKIS